MITNYGYIIDIYEEDFDMASCVYFYKAIKDTNKRKELLELKKNKNNLSYSDKKSMESFAGTNALTQQAIMEHNVFSGDTAKTSYKNRYMGNILTAYTPSNLKDPERLENRFSKMIEEMIDGDLLILIPDTGLTSECWTNTVKYSIVYTVLDAKINIGNIVQKDVLRFLLKAGE